MYRKTLLLTSLMLLLLLTACGTSSDQNQGLPSSSGEVANVGENQQDDQINSELEPVIDKTSDLITQEVPEIKFRIDEPEYKPMLDLVKPGPVIPGLLQDLIPQGIAYMKEQDWLLMSAYRDSDKPSVLSVIDAKSGELIKSFHLYQENEEPYKGHAGGLTVSEQYAWVASNGYDYQIPLADIVAGEDNTKLYFMDRIKTDSRASFNAYADGVLWTGEFAYGIDYPTSKEHRITARAGEDHRAWVVGVKLDPETDMITDEQQQQDPVVPDFILSVTERIQGIVFRDDEIILSQSYGRNNYSTLLFYSNVLKEEPHSYVDFAGHEVPLWFLDGESIVKTITGPPMSEGIIDRDDVLYILFESAADKYRVSGNYPLEHILMLELN